MTDAVAFLTTITRVVQNFSGVLEDLQQIADRIGADTSLSTATAQAAQQANRRDLTTADFDNLKVAINLLSTLLSATNGGNVPVSINTGGTVKLAFYKVL